MILSRAAFVYCLAIALCGSVTAQEEYFTGTPAVGARPLVAFGTQENGNTVLQAATCIKALDVAYDIYSYTGNWSYVPNQPHLDASHNIFCFSLNPIGVSSNESVIKVHSQFPAGWTAEDEILYGGVANNKTTGTIDATEDIIAAVRPVADIDGSYFSTTLPLGGPAGGTSSVGDVVGRVIYGKSKQDLGEIFWCACIYSVHAPTTTPVSQAG